MTAGGFARFFVSLLDGDDDVVRPAVATSTSPSNAALHGRLGPTSVNAAENDSAARRYASGARCMLVTWFNVDAFCQFGAKSLRCSMKEPQATVLLTPEVSEARVVE